MKAKNQLKIKATAKSLNALSEKNKTKHQNAATAKPQKANKRRAQAEEFGGKRKRAKLETKTAANLKQHKAKGAQRKGNKINKQLEIKYVFSDTVKLRKENEYRTELHENSEASQDELAQDGDSSGSEYSLDSNEDFFRKPELFVCDELLPIPLELQPGAEEQQVEKPWLLHIEEQSDATVTKIMVYEKVFAKAERNNEPVLEAEAELDEVALELQREREAVGKKGRDKEALELAVESDEEAVELAADSDEEALKLAEESDKEKLELAEDSEKEALELADESDEEAVELELAAESDESLELVDELDAEALELAVESGVGSLELEEEPVEALQRKKKPDEALELEPELEPEPVLTKEPAGSREPIAATEPELQKEPVAATRAEAVPNALQAEAVEEVILLDDEDEEDQLDSTANVDIFAGTKLDAQLLELSVFENSLKTNDVLAVLKQDMELYGSAVVTLLAGQISINGYRARPHEALTIYSPKGLNWVVISPRPNKQRGKQALDWSSTTLQAIFSRAQLDNIAGNYNAQRDAIVLLQRNSAAQRLQCIFGRHMAEHVFPQLNASSRPHYASEYLLNCLLQCSVPGSGLQVPTVWTKLALQASTRLLVAGGKGVGKSTLLRYLLNRHLRQPFQRLLLIDLDIGQPELFVPQTVYCSLVDAPLLGHGLFLNSQPERAYAVGHVNIVMCAEQYVRAVRQLLAHCRSNANYAGIPWLINTMGYNKGFGMELMALLVHCVQPTDVVQIAGAKAINNYDEPLDWRHLSQLKPIIYAAEEFRLAGAALPKYTLHQLRSAVPAVEQQRGSRAWRMSARDVRYANLLARLSCALRGNARHLSDCLPVQVELSALQLLQLGAEQEYTREELIAGLEANLVYLCRRQPKERTVECLGIGVVRAIDYQAQRLYLLPAMPLQRLCGVNCLVLCGDACLPQGFFKEQGAGVANKVPFVFITDDSRASKSVQQIYHRAPGFLGAPNRRPD
ncbi:hypothetical protein KR222_011274 [Zaprionus bogoriensis]|nr:hypothetical protein KR222_011274 [Zaprionus bogoriensis]